MANFPLQIVTPDRLVFDGLAEKVIVRTVGGDACILARHIDYAAPLGIGVAKITDDQGHTRQAACNGGLLSVSGGRVRLLATTFEWADEIDLPRAENARDAAQRQLETLKKGDRDFSSMEAKLKRALTRIQTKG